MMFVKGSANSHGFVNPRDIEQMWLVDAVLAAATGDWLYQAMRPSPPNLPTLCAHQIAKGAAALAWLRSREPDGL